jgi:hypothetical protein
MNCACYCTENIGVCQFWNIRKNPKYIDIILSGPLLRREEIDKIRTENQTMLDIEEEYESVNEYYTNIDIHEYND